MEYGLYFSEIKEKRIFSSCESCDSSDSSKHPNRVDNDNLYWYINRDGVRITKINNTFFDDKTNYKSNIVSQIIETNHYGIRFEEFINKNKKLLFNITLFDCIDYSIENKITLKEVCGIFIGQKWKAKNYNFALKNCHHFSAEIIRILKAKRENEYYKIRSVEKLILLNCIISALWDNERISFTNTMGRIPNLGLFYDFYKMAKI